jgi:hypothetical protein
MSNCIYYQDFYGFVKCKLQDKLTDDNECSICKDRVTWQGCPERIVRNNEEDLCKLSGDVCYREECNKIKEMENGRN